MRSRVLRFAAWMVLGLAPCANAESDKVLDALGKYGLEGLKGSWRALDPVPLACNGTLPSAWYNNVKPYMTIVLPGRVDENPAWEKLNRSLQPTYFLRQDEAVLLVGSTPPPMNYFSFETFLFGRYNEKSLTWDPKTGGFFAPYELPFAYVGDPLNSLTIRTTGSTPFNQRFALVSTGNATTLERLRAMLRAIGYPDAAINTETLPHSLLRFGYLKGDQFLYMIRSAGAVGGDAVMSAWQQAVLDGKVMQVYRVRPQVEIDRNPLPTPTLRPAGTGHTEIDLYPTMEKLRAGILAHVAREHLDEYVADELDTNTPDVFPEGYAAIQRGIVYQGPGRDGSAGYDRDANYWVTPWFDLPDDGFAIAYGVNHALSGKATYSNVTVYLDEKIAAGVAGFDTGDLVAMPDTALPYAPEEPQIHKFYVWKIARDCHGQDGCVEARLRPDLKQTCADAIAEPAPVRIGFRKYAEPATKVAPADAELVYDRVILFRPKK